MKPVTTTYLEMTDATHVRPAPCSDPRFRIDEATEGQWRFNRFLYELVGQDWNWRDKLDWSEDRWRHYVENPALRTFVAYYDGSPAGYFELQQDRDEVEIVYLGLAPAFIGRGFGGALITRALQEAWTMKPKRVWLHTCTDDHPTALTHYQARGLHIYKRESKKGDIPLFL